MKQCVNDIVAFGLNQAEFDLVAFGVIMVFAVLVAGGVIMYLNHGVGETKEERWARKNPFLAVDLDMHPKKRSDLWD